jgi:predicted transcriptional regulator
MTLKKNRSGLHFPCECVSAQSGYSDPWAEIAQKKLLPNGTKERILNSVARQPNTIAGLAKELGLSQPAIHTHVNDLLRSELLRESLEWEKRFPAEKYYEANFPIVKAADRRAFNRVCETIAEEMAVAFADRLKELQEALKETTMARGGWQFPDVAHFCFTSAQRGARQRLERRGILSARVKHRNGAEWVFWAEEPG